MNDLKKEACSLGQSIGINKDEILEKVFGYIIHPMDETIIDDMLYIKNKDQYTYKHCLGVTCLAGMVIHDMKLSPIIGEQVIIGAFIHDIGKTLIPQEILNKPGKLTVQEYNYMKAHPEVGYELVKNNPNLTHLIKLAPLYHHEREDGSGYPTGENTHVPYEIKIIAACDITHALLADRPYKRAMSVIEVLKILEKEPIDQRIRKILSGILQKGMHS